MKVLAYGVREVGITNFRTSKQKFGYELTCIPEYLNSEENARKAERFKAVIFTVQLLQTKKLFRYSQRIRVEYVLIRTVGKPHRC